MTAPDNYPPAPVPFPTRRRLAELVCVLFGHEWNIHGCTSDEQGIILEEYSECTRCRLENHDRAGFAARYEEACQRRSKQ